jgi:hypothetical protein
VNRPRLYLDVDGVILPSGKFETTKFPFEMECVNDIIYFPPEVITRLGATGCDLVWCTSWKESELDNELTPHFTELNNGRTIRPEGITRVDNKFKAIMKDQIESPSPFIWVDDRITDKLRNKVATRFAVTKHQIVIPNKTIGLSLADLEQIEAFAEQYI